MHLSAVQAQLAALKAQIFFRSVAGLRRVGVCVPSYAAGAIRRLAGFLERTPSPRVWEWGSGWSSIWYAKQVASLVSVEHDRDWWLRVSSELRRRGYSHAECRLVPVLVPEVLASVRWERDWPHFCTLKGPPRKPEFRDYMAAIDGFPDEYFDVIAIDGRERIGCLVHGVRKLKSSGLLVLDDSDRAKYGEAFNLLQAWRLELFRTLGHETAVFVKPG